METSPAAEKCTLLEQIRSTGPCCHDSGSREEVIERRGEREGRGENRKEIERGTGTIRAN